MRSSVKGASLSTFNEAARVLKGARENDCTVALHGLGDASSTMYILKIIITSVALDLRVLVMVSAKSRARPTEFIFFLTAYRI